MYRQFYFALKDGRIFCCEQDLDKTFIVRSDKHGAVICNWWGKMVADASYNSDVFVKRIKAIKKTAENLANYLNNVSPEEIVEHKMADIVAGLYLYATRGASKNLLTIFKYEHSFSIFKKEIC